MAWKNFAIARRQRAVATALVYGLSLTVRFTSSTGDEASAHAAQGAMNSIMLSDAFYNSLPPKPALPIGFTRGWPLSPRICRAACEGSVPTSLMLTCPAP